MGGVQDPSKVDLLDPKSGFFEHPLKPPTKTPFVAHFVAKSGPFGRWAWNEDTQFTYISPKTAEEMVSWALAQM